MGREQVKEGSHALDLCTAFVGRDEIKEMTEVVARMRGSVTAPLVIDSTELPVLEAALKLYGGTFAEFQRLVEAGDLEGVEKIFNRGRAMRAEIR